MDRGQRAALAPFVGATILGLLAGGPFVALGAGADLRWIAPVGFQALWCITEGYLVMRNRSGDRSGDSAWGIAHAVAAGALFVTTVSLGELLLSLRLHGPVARMTQPRFGLLISGLAVGLFGLGLRLSAIRILGSRFRDDVALGSDHPIERGGPYAWCRHPGELGFALAILGHVAMCRSTLGIVLFVCLTVPLSLVRVWQEDRMIATHQD